MDILLAIREGVESVTTGLGGMLRGCGVFIAVTLVVIAVYTIYSEIRSIILHEQPNKVDGVEPLSSKATFVAAAAMLTVAAVILVAAFI